MLAGAGGVVVTGGGGEIGGAVARMLRDRGQRVVTWGRSPIPDEPVSHICCDITDPEQVEAACAKSDAMLGRIEILINSAGISQFERFLDLPAGEFGRILEVNLNGPVNCMRAVIPRMLAVGSGSIINITSIWATHVGPLRSAYIASKWGLLGVTKSLMEEYRDTGLRICAVSPGPVVTKLSERMIPRAERHLWMSPDEIAEVIVRVALTKGDQFIGSEIQAYGRARPTGMA